MGVSFSAVNTADKYTVIEEVAADTRRLIVEVNKQTCIHSITHSQGICSQSVTIHQTPQDEKAMLLLAIHRLERENERLLALIEKLTTQL